MSTDSDKCWACGKTLEEHEDSRPAGAPQPRMPCLGLKAHFCSSEKRESDKAKLKAAWEEAKSDPQNQRVLEELANR